ncbi:hypothetical protein RDI58_007136 [Solanum bulbocastanum]|uniref:Uncharacterized protein n=1 Tax=Solanum bulbocastanum TaxID=147425 RepID=A0AAN8TS93_SOLBU
MSAGGGYHDFRALQWSHGLLNVEFDAMAGRLLTIVVVVQHLGCHLFHFVSQRVVLIRLVASGSVGFLADGCATGFWH